MMPIEHASFAPDSPPDSETRRIALDPARSFAVSAPAGSGKTGLLTQRVLRLLATCEEPEEVLAITFTRKAAGEMQERILQALWSTREPAPASPHGRLTWELASTVIQRDQEKGWNLLFSPQRLRVQTIDSLCRSITRQLPLASGLGAQPDTLDNADNAYRLAVRELIGLLEQDSPLQDDLTRLLRHLDNNLPAIENLLVMLLAKREQWLDLLLQARHTEARSYLQHVLESVVIEHLSQVNERLSLYGGDVCFIADEAATNLSQEPSGKIIQPHGIEHLKGIHGLPAVDTEDVLVWQQLVELLLTGGGTFRARLTKNEGFPAGAPGKALKERFQTLVAHLQESGSDIEALLHGVRQLPPAAYNEEQWQLLDSLTRVLPVLAAQLKLVFRQLAATDFTEITQAALTALGDEDSPTDIALQLDYRIRHILVDEFQDTASPQLLLLERLTAGWQAGDGRTLFIVGDGMQSCYGFRNANVGLFLRAREQGIGDVELEAIDLTVNFRSQAGVVQWVNDTFSEAFPASNDISRGAVSYSPSIAAKALRDNAAVTVYACSYDTADDDDEESGQARQLAQQQEADTVAALAKQALEDTEGSVAILVRTRSHLSKILPSLSAAGLTWLATEIDSLASRMAIVDLISLTRALLDPGDRIAWLSILRAPWCGLDLYDLHRIANADVGEQSPRLRAQEFPVIYQQLLHLEHIEGLSAHGTAATQRLLAALKPALDNRARKPLRQWVEGVWLALGGPASLADQDDLNNIPSYFALLDKHQHGGGIRDWEAFTRAVASLYAEPRSDANPRLQVMTIHKSKGLEFDTVIIPGLDRRTRNDDKQLLLWQERISEHGEAQLLLGPLAATGEKESALYTFMRQESDLQQRYEATRLLYVGCTRAINRLFLLGCIQQKNETLQAPGKSALLSSIWPQVQAQVEMPPQSANTKPQSATVRTLSHILRLPADWQAPPLRDVELLNAYRGSEFDDEENIPESETIVNRLARHTGTVLHQALQIVTQENRLPDLTAETMSAYIEQQRDWWRLHLQSLGWQQHWLAQGLDKVERAFRQTLNNTQGRWLLDNQHAESACELSLQYWQGEQLRQSIVDRTFVVDEVRWIVDYKSSEPQEGQSVAEFIEQETVAYRPQLQRYRQCFANMETRTIKTALYFPMLAEQALVEVSPAPATQDA